MRQGRDAIFGAAGVDQSGHGAAVSATERLGMKMDELHTNSLSFLCGLGGRKDPRKYFDRRALMFEGGALQGFCAVGEKSQTKFPLSP
jgi:hypothetical protein